MTVCKTGPDPLPCIGHKVLEIIVTSVEEAIEAEQGGADRLEVVRSLEQGGLTPEFDLVRKITAAVRLPVRVMIRGQNSMSLLRGGKSDRSEVNRLAAAADRVAQLQIDGLVLGFIREGRVDEPVMGQILSAVPGFPATFHRAFEHLQSPSAALVTLKGFSQIDRVLVRVREDGSGISLAQVRAWQCLAAPHIRFIAGIGLDRALLGSVRDEAGLGEVHAGRAAREPETTSGAVSRLKVAQLKSALL